MIKFNYLQFFIIIIIFSILYILIINYLHPIYLLILIIIYRGIICFIISAWSYNYIYSIILFLIIIRGILIIFLYFSRLISNNQTKFSINLPLIIRFLLNITILLFLIIKYFNYPLYNYNFNEIFSSFQLNNNIFNNIIYIFSHPYRNITIICILYLLLTLFTIIKICSIKSSTLRKLN